jgi:hypothetical protein
MAGLIQTTMSGGANKAVAGGVMTFVGAEYVDPILEWLVDVLSGALQASTGAAIPDPAQFGLQGLAMIAIGAAVVYNIPNKEPV